MRNEERPTDDDYTGPVGSAVMQQETERCRLIITHNANHTEVGLIVRKVCGCVCVCACVCACTAVFSCRIYLCPAGSGKPFGSHRVDVPKKTHSTLTL